MRENDGYALLDAVRGGNLGQRRHAGKIAALVGTMFVLAVGTFLLFKNDSLPYYNLATDEESSTYSPRTAISLCGGYNETLQPQLDTSEAKYLNLSDDQFTIVIQTYKREEILQSTIKTILKGNPESLHTIIVAWNDIDTDPPEDWESAGGVPVVYRKSTVNSLNQKFLPDANITTKAVLLADDDCYYETGDLEIAFKAWQDTGRGRLVGAWPRLATTKKDGKMTYNLPRLRKDYNMVLTGLAFTHIAFLDMYSSDLPIATKIRNYVDEQFNCEDIGLNYLMQSTTGCPALFVKGENGVKMAKKPKGTKAISSKPGHLAHRRACLDKFNEFFGYNPLVNTTSFIISGEVHAP